MEFLEEAKQVYWREKRKNTQVFRVRLERLLLDRLAKIGEITEDDILWARILVDEFFGEPRQDE